MSSIPAIKFEIAYEGSSQCWKNANVCAIDLLGTKSEISAHSVVPGDSSLKAGRLKWCTPNNDAHLDQITLPTEIARAIQFTARIFETYYNPWRMIKGLDGINRPVQRERRYNVPITIEDRPKFETGKCYLIKVQAVGEYSFKATFTKVDEQASKTSKDEDERKVSREEVQRGMRKMGEALITEGLKNLQLASRGGASVFNSSSTPADVFAHVSQGIIRSAQQMVPEIRVPASRPSESVSDLNQLSVQVLQSRFEEVFKKDQEFEKQHQQARLAGDMKKYNRILQAEQANSGLFIRLAVALENKGVTPQIPQ